MLSVYVMHPLTHQNCVLKAERSPHIPVRYLLGYRDRLNGQLKSVNSMSLNIYSNISWVNHVISITLQSSSYPVRSHRCVWIEPNGHSFTQLSNHETREHLPVSIVHICFIFRSWTVRPSCRWRSPEWRKGSTQSWRPMGRCLWRKVSTQSFHISSFS